MNVFDIQILQAIAAYDNTYGGSSCDLDIRGEGEKLFGESWGGALKKAKEYSYSPYISFRCGALRKRGLLERHALPGSNSNYGAWDLTAQGQALVDSMPTITTKA